MMKHYEDILELAQITGTFTSHSKALSKIRVKGSDPQLLKHLDITIDYLQSCYAAADHVSVPTRLVKHTDARPKALIAYCKSKVGEKVPEWQVTALAHGWTPPATSKRSGSKT
jgi:hypothetical protein